MTSVLLAINWGNALIVTLVGFGLVIVLLIVLVWVLMLFGWFFTHFGNAAKMSERVDQAGQVSKISSQSLTDEELAAVAVALNTTFFAVHDIEDLTLTINHDGQSGDWTSKYTVLTQ